MSVLSPPQALQVSLIQALEGSDPERALEQAYIQLSRGADLSLLLALVKALVRSGLAGMALRLLQQISGALAAEPQLAALAERLAQVPSGEVDDRQRREQFDRNVALLRERGALHPPLELVFAADEHVFRSRKGNWHALRDADGGAFQPIFPLADQAQSGAELALPPVTLTSACLMIGVPAPAVLQRFMTQEHQLGYKPPAYVIEPDPAVLSLWLSMIDLAPFLVDDRLLLFAGAGAVQMYERLMCTSLTMAMPTTVLTNHRPRWQPPVVSPRAAEAISQQRATIATEQKAALDTIYESRDDDWWDRRFASARQGKIRLTVLGMTTRFSTVIQHVMRDLQGAFSRFGCDFHVVKQPAASHASIDVAAELLKWKPDLVFVINHLRCEMRDLIPSRLPFVGWIQDHMPALWTREAGKTVGPFDLVLTHAPGLMSQVYGYPQHYCLPTANLTDAVTYSDAPLEEEALAPWRCDLSYIGHGSETPEQLAQTMAGGDLSLRRYLHLVLQQLQSGLERQPYLTIADRLKIMIRSEQESGCSSFTPALRSQTIYPAVERLYDRLFRHQSLEWVARWVASRGRTFFIFGHGWHAHPTLHGFARGPIENGAPLRAVYQASTISLQTNGYQSLHQRLLDGIAAGGCVLSRFNPSDFHSTWLRVVQSHIVRRRLRDLPSLLDSARANMEVAEALEMAERMSGFRIALVQDPKRREDIALMQQWGFWPASTFSDEGLFQSLVTLNEHAHRTAGDVPGFSETTFETERHLHEMLDRLVDDRAACRRLMRPLRDSVIAHDTYDVLVRRVMDAWATRWRTA